MLGSITVLCMYACWHIRQNDRDMKLQNISWWYRSDGYRSTILQFLLFRAISIGYFIPKNIPTATLIFDRSRIAMRQTYAVNLMAYKMDYRIRRRSNKRASVFECHEYLRQHGEKSNFWWCSRSALVYAYNVSSVLYLVNRKRRRVHELLQTVRDIYNSGYECRATESRNSLGIRGERGRGGR